MSEVRMGGAGMSEIIDICPHCDSENVFEDWDTDEKGFVAECKHCGHKMMLCDACGSYDEENGWQRDNCDWHMENGYSVCHRGKYKED